MRRWILLVILAAGILALGQVIPAVAQDAAPATKSASPKVLAKVEFHGNSIEEIVDVLRQLDPDFKVIVARQPDAPQDYPKVDLSMNNVTAGDVVMAIATAYPSVHLMVTGSTAGFAIGNGNVVFNNGPQDQKTIYCLTIDSPPASAKPREVVKIYNLQPLFGNSNQVGAQNAKRTGHTLPEILSLIQAVCDETDAKPSLHVHEATQSLIVKGTLEQQEAVAQAIQALMPALPSPFVGVEGQLQLQQQMDLLKANESELQRKLMENRVQELNAASQPANNQ